MVITEGFRCSCGGDGVDGADGDSDDEGEAEPGVDLDPAGLAAGLVSWAVGVAAGRFDVRLATGERGWPAEPGPFDPLPVRSPGRSSGDRVPRGRRHRMGIRWGRRRCWSMIRVMCWI